jgi:hypothetical protein
MRRTELCGFLGVAIAGCYISGLRVTHLPCWRGATTASVAFKDRVRRGGQDEGSGGGGGVSPYDLLNSGGQLRLLCRTCG